ncbi:DUF1963 domain-containing protein [Solirubrobacter pauli]|uniref:DUF1963 domain-containing protein n=1 Tax=Solirubrobacter pauli TaxID=166793 RepID=UPI0014772A7B|nr:DUF1963 domain-containing protein [Solirubrobacter pauli]
MIDDRGHEHDAEVFPDAASVGIDHVIVLDGGLTTEGWKWWTLTSDEPVFSEPLVRFTDGAGDLVAGPLGSRIGTPIEDATEACPVCGAVAWVAIDYHVGCKRCGYVPGHAVHFARDTPGDGALDIDDDDDGDVDEEDEDLAALKAARFTIYAAAGQTPESFDHSRRGHEVVTARVMYTSNESLLFVETRTAGAAEFPAAAHLAGFSLWDGRDDTGLSDGAIQVRHADRVRRARRRALSVDSAMREIPIDGRAAAFTFSALDDAWVATRRHGRLTLAVVGYKVDPATVTLAPLHGVGNAPEPRKVALARRAAAGELLSRAEVEHLIDEHGLGEHRETILAHIAAGYRLQRVPDSPHRVGGLPDLAPGEGWPHDEDGVPFTFIAQIDCTQLPSLQSEFPSAVFNHGGRLLRLFGRMNAAEMVPDEAVGLLCAPDAPLTRAELPALPNPMPPDVELEDSDLRELYGEPVRPLPFLTARYEPFGDFDDYSEFRSRLAAGGVRRREDAWDDPQLLGYAGNEQGSDPVAAGPWVYDDTAEDDWCVLVHLPGMDWGSLSVLIRRVDLAAGRFDRLATDISLS